MIILGEQMSKTFNDYTVKELEGIKDRNQLYEIFKNSYDILPDEIKEHRKYFVDGRGFGEDAFHAMWYYIFKNYRPQNVLEIGIYRGQTLSLFQLLSDHFNIGSNVVGISPLTAAGDSKSNYIELDYEKDILVNFDKFNLKHPKLVKSFSNHGPARYEIKSSTWDLIYIDGCHDYDIVLVDYYNCVDALNQQGILVLDDSSLYEDFNYPGSFKGHEGPSKVVRDFIQPELDNFLAVGHNNCFRIPNE
jgi:hypothetical protein